MTKMLERHPLSALCLDMTPDEFIALQDSIGNEGVQDPIQLFQGKVLDGWHRYSAATGLGMPCPTEQFQGTLEEAKAFVLRKHTRRNWTKEQRALVFASVYAFRAPGRPEKNTALGADLPPTNAEKATVADVSQRTMERATVVARKAIPKVIDAVNSGEIGLKDAEQIAQLPKREQPKATEAVKKERAAKKEQPKPEKGAWRPVGATPRPVVGATIEAMDEMKEKQAVLSEEVDRLSDRLAVAAMSATDEERTLAAETIAGLRATVKRQEVEIRALTASRDSYMTECTELRRQCEKYRNQLTRQRA